jgi:hypothetical protein
VGIDKTATGGEGGKRKMDRQFSERQLIRWAVPGWITLFIIGIVVFIQLCFNQEMWNSFQSFFKDNSLGEIAAIGAAIIAAGFALGFILFQIYFVLYWTDNKLCNFIVGGFVNYEEIVKSLDKYKGTLKRQFGNWPIKDTSARGQRQKLESSIVAAWWRSMSRQKDEQRMVWEGRNQYLVAVYHSMGSILA